MEVEDILKKFPEQIKEAVSLVKDVRIKGVINNILICGVGGSGIGGNLLRDYLKEELKIPMPNLEKEIKMLQMHSDARVGAITINHENMSSEEIESIVYQYEERFGIPCCDVLRHGCGKLVDKIQESFLG